MIKNILHIDIFFKKRPDTGNSVFDYEKIKRYFENNDTEEVFLVLTEQTCSDLDFDEFFIRVNGTVSCIGQQYLYDCLRRIRDVPAMAGCDDILQYLKSNTECTTRCRKYLSALANHDAYYVSSLFQERHPDPSPLLRRVVKVLQFMPLLLTAIFIFFMNTVWFLLLMVFIITNLVLHYRNKQLQFVYLYSFPQFFKLVSIAGKLSEEPVFANTHPDIKNRLHALQPLVRGLSHFRFEVKLENELVALLWGIRELIRIFFLSEPNVLYRSFRLMDMKKKDIKAVFVFVGHVDMLLSVVRLQENLPYYCKPQWSDEGLRIADAYHPLIEQCVPKTLDTAGKSILLTGSNMSGKTTFIRTIALNMLSAQTLNMCFAQSFNGRRMRIHSAINLYDDYYLLKHGKLKHRNAIRLLELQGYPQNVVAEANAIVNMQY